MRGRNEVVKSSLIIPMSFITEVCVLIKAELSHNPLRIIENILELIIFHKGSFAGRRNKDQENGELESPSVSVKERNSFL